MEKTSIKNTAAPVAGETHPRRSKEEFLQRFRQPGSVSFTEWSDFVAYVRAQQEQTGQVIEEKPTAKPIADLNLKTLTGRDNEEALREMREKQRDSKPFKDDAEFFAHTRAQWDAKQKANESSGE